MGEPYTLRFTEKSVRGLNRLERSTAEHILDKLHWLAENAAVAVHVPLTGEWSGFYRLQVGDYRVIYQLSHNMHLIVAESISDE